MSLCVRVWRSVRSFFPLTNVVDNNYHSSIQMAPFEYSKHCHSLIGWFESLEPRLDTNLLQEAQARVRIIQDRIKQLKIGTSVMLTIGIILYTLMLVIMCSYRYHP